MKKRLLPVLLSLVIAFGLLPTTFSVKAKFGYVQRQTSEVGIAFIEAFEGYAQYAYWDYTQYSIGYGTACEKDEYPAGISEPYAHNLLKKVLPTYENGVNKFLKSSDIYVTQNQYDALVSFTYNLGAYIWESRESTIETYLKNGIENYTDKQIADAFGLWVNAGGEVHQGLVDRRKAEAKLFCKDDITRRYEVYVIKDSVTVRASASTSAKSLGSLARGEVLRVYEKKYIGTRVWGKIKYNSSDAWICLDYAKYGHDTFEGDTLVKTVLYEVENVSGGITLKWNKVTAATGYKIYRAKDGGEFSLIKTTTKNTTLSYKDTNVSKHKTYTYYVTSYNDTKDATASEKSTITYVAAPSGLKLSKTTNSFKLSWTSSSDASGYYVYRKGEGDSYYSKIGSTSSASYTDSKIASGVKYHYVVKSYNSYGIGGESNSVSGIIILIPTITKATNTKDSITISWTDCGAVDGFKVYRQIKGGTTKLIKTVTSATTLGYKDSSVSADKQYVYYVSSYIGETETKKSSSFTTRIHTPPTITSVKTQKTGMQIKWNASATATSYNVYHKVSGDENYSFIGSTSSLSFTHNEATIGKKNYYRITTVVNTKRESYKSDYKGANFTPTTTIVKAVTAEKGMKITWNSVYQAESYSVYKYADKKYTLLKSGVTSVSYTDTTNTSAKKAYYAVKVNYPSATSGYSSLIKAVRLPKPKLKLTESSGGFKLSWQNVDNFKGIRIYRKDPGKDDFTLYTTKESYDKNSFDNTTVDKKKQYEYYIVFINGNSESLASNVVKNTLKETFAKTSITSAKGSTDGLILKWSKKSGAKSYSVYKYQSGKYTLLKKVTTNSYTDGALKVGKSAKYAVKVNYANGSSAYSTLFTGYFIKRPTLKVTKSDNGLLLSWNDVANWKNVRIYRKAQGESTFTLYSDQKNYSKCTFDNTTVVSGQKYSYYIVLYNGKSFSRNSATVTLTK